MRTLAITLIASIAVFMIGTVIIAFVQEEIGWTWWWTFPIGVAFVAGIIGFRLLVQRAGEAADRLDRELDAAERERGE